MFKLTSTPLESLNLKKGLLSSHAGAFCVFEGWVRNHNEGKRVKFLEYEAQEILCQKEAQAIFKEAQKKFEVIALRCYHRVGKIRIGEMAVWVGVVSVHRNEAFKACRYIIDEVKKRLPIWKKEFYANGHSGWVNAKGQSPKRFAKKGIVA
jgi:molybdopterin synthase catalytic subunit